MTDRQENDRTRPELRWPGQPCCRYCGEPLDRLRAGLGWCGGTLCATRHRNEAEREVYRRSWNEYVDRVEQGVDDHGPEIVAAARTLGVAVEEMPIGIVPHLRRPLAPLPDARRAALLAHVRAVTAESFANGDPEPRARAETEDRTAGTRFHERRLYRVPGALLRAGCREERLSDRQDDRTCAPAGPGSGPGGDRRALCRDAAGAVGRGFLCLPRPDGLHVVSATGAPTCATASSATASAERGRRFSSPRSTVCSGSRQKRAARKPRS